MGKVGTGAFQPMWADTIEKEYPHFTQTFGRHYSFVAKTHGVIIVAFSSQFYGRTPNGMAVSIKKNGHALAFNANAGSTAPSTSAIFNKSPGDDITIDLEVRASGADVGCDYWISAMTNEPIKFSET